MFAPFDPTVRKGVGEWSAVYLWRNGIKDKVNCAAFPATMAALCALASSAFREVSYEGLEEPGCAFASAYLSKLTPGTLITPHCGPCNARLRVHLALRIPEDEGRGGNGVNFWKKRRSSVVGQLAGGSRMSSSAGGADGCWRSGACCTRCTCSWCGRSSRRFVSRRGSWGRLGRSSGSDRRRCVFSPSAKKSYGGRKGGACSSTIASCTAPSTDNAT